MNIVMIVQARMTSNRLPGKVLKKVLGKPLLEYQIERLRSVKNAHHLVIATTTNETDQPIVGWCERYGVDYFRGSENDVLSRYYHAAKKCVADIVVRLTSDCPLIDPIVVDQVIKYYLDNLNQYDYISNSLTRSYPRGMDTEVFSFKVLSEAYLNSTMDLEKEHVTPYIYTRPLNYRIGQYRYSVDESEHRWTVDTAEDFELIRLILEELYPSKPEFTLEDCLRLLEQNPEWVEINRHIEQKKLGQ
jgi:spore coat polysaccharide biosynthesis protein SpsF